MKRSLGDEVYAFSEFFDHAEVLWGFYTSFLDVASGMAGMGRCEDFFSFAESEKYLIQHDRLPRGTWGYFVITDICPGIFSLRKKT